MNLGGFGSSFKSPEDSAFKRGGFAGRSQTTFKALRRLHGQNLESKGLNDITDAFQQFVTRARFFSIGKLRRTWSHSAVEFMKYRRLLPMLLADGERMDPSETDDFDAALAFQAASKDDRKIVVSNISPRVTQTQLQSFFSQFGKVSNCSLPLTERRSVFATLPKNPKHCGSAVIIFKRKEDADKAKSATEEELKLYDQVMHVSAYSSSKKRSTKGAMIIPAEDNKDEGTSMSRASSTQSLTASTISASGNSPFPLDTLPDKVLERIISFLPIIDTIRCEMVNKRWMELSMSSWSHINTLILARETYGFARFFQGQGSIRNSHLKALLRRGGLYLKSLNLSGISHLMNGSALQLISSLCPNLKDLNISGLASSPSELNELSEALPTLEKISYIDMANASDKAFWFLLKGCGRSVKFVDFRGARRLHGRCFKLVGPELEQLYLDGSYQIDAMAFEDLCTFAPGLKELRANECYRISDENLSMVSRTMADLQALTLCGDRFSALTSTGLLHISHIHSLTELALDFNPLVDDRLLEAISCELKSLTALSLANAGTDQSISAKGINSISKLTNLSQLDASFLAAVSSSSIWDILTDCKQLELLQLRNCTFLSNDAVFQMAKCHNVKHVDLSGSILVTTEAIQNFIKAFPSGDNKPQITIVIGGTAAESSSLSVRGSRVVVDLSDYSSLVHLPSEDPSVLKMGTSQSVDNSDNEDEFEKLTAQRSFYIDAICGEEESPIEDVEELKKWAEREAKELGLIK
ncbi:hypothetical protein WR25_02250 [Diploscapter pachys]|uniref:RRM domain-containing protein n=1 Tax=Diploscapter pachys TaxID=2018661 RepID=A0A2A2LEP6_9BILA|nr:hypothetical protein WR25_02250 [Diploscapter pachys]